MSWMRRKALWLVLLASLAFNAGVGATVGVRAYQQVREPRGPHGGPGGCDLAKQLGLTPEQVTELDAARAELMSNLEATSHEVSLAHEALAELMTVAEPDRAAIDEQIERIGALRQQQQRELVEHFLEVKARLTPEQTEAFNELIRRVLSRPGRGLGGFGGPHGPRGGHGRGLRGPRHGGRDGDLPEPTEK